jgi:hypothetical protein
MWLCVPTGDIGGNRQSKVSRVWSGAMGLLESRRVELVVWHDNWTGRSGVAVYAGA